MQQIGPAGESASYGKSSAKSPRGLRTGKVFQEIVAGGVQWPATPAEMREQQPGTTDLTAYIHRCRSRRAEQDPLAKSCTVPTLPV